MTGLPLTILLLKFCAEQFLWEPDSNNTLPKYNGNYPNQILVIVMKDKNVPINFWSFTYHWLRNQVNLRGSM